MSWIYNNITCLIIWWSMTASSGFYEEQSEKWKFWIYTITWDSKTQTQTSLIYFGYLRIKWFENDLIKAALIDIEIKIRPECGSHHIFSFYLKQLNYQNESRTWTKKRSPSFNKRKKNEKKWLKILLNSKIINSEKYWLFDSEM